MIRPHNHFFLPTACCQLLLLLAPMAVAAQSPELVHAKARLQALRIGLEKLDETIAQELEAALVGQVDTRPKDEFETTAEYQARLEAAKEARERLAPEYERKKGDRRRSIQEKIEALTSRYYSAPIRIRLGTYDADSETFPFFVRATGDSGTIEIPRAVAKEAKTNLGTLKQTGYWELGKSGNDQLAAIAVEHNTGTYTGLVTFLTFEGPTESILSFEGHTKGVLSVAFSPDGRYALSGSGDNTLKLWETSSGQLVRTFEGHTGTVWSVAFSPDGRYVLSGSSDNTLKLWEIASGRLVRTFKGHTKSVWSVAFSPDGSLALSGGNDKTLKLWEIASGRLVRTFEGHTEAVLSVAFSPDGRLALSGSYNNTLKLWKTASGRLVRTFEGHTEAVLSVAFSPDGRLALSGSSDNTLKLWETASGRLVQTFTGHTKSVSSVAFSPDGRQALSGSYDKTLKLWETASGRLVRTFKGHTNLVRSVAFSPDGRLALSGSWDNTLKLWRVTPVVDEQLLAAIRSGAAPGAEGKGPSLPPALSAAVTFSEPSGDSLLAANEEAALQVILTNSGKGSAYGIEVTLRLSKGDFSGRKGDAAGGKGGALRRAQGDISGLSFPSSRYIGEIPPGKTRQVAIPLKAGIGLPSGTATITCTFSEANGFEPDPIEITFDTRAYQPPELVIADVGIDDASGNGMIEAGEVVTVMVRVQNLGRGAAEKAEAEVKMGENVFFAEGSTAQFDLGTLPPGAFKDLQFQLYTNRRAREIAVTMSLIERHGKYGLADAPLELPFNRPVRTIQQVVIAGTETALPEVDDASGLSIDVEREIPKGRDQRKDAVALLIANRDYMDPDIPAVTYAHRDAEFVKQYLVRTLGYREGNIFLYRDATQSNFRTALRKLQNAAKKKADVFVYYTGHGAPDPEEKAGYFVPVDCDPNYVQLGGVGLEEFYKELGRIKARNITVVIDACFSGASAAGMLIAEASPIFISVEDPAASLANGVVLTSSSGEQISSWYPQMRHSLYTYYFLKALQGAADQDGDRQLTVVELQAYLEEQVPYMARRLHNRLQTPGVTPGRSERVLVRYE